MVVSLSQATLAIGAVAYAPSNGSIIYAGTGNYANGYTGLGILKSTNGAATWTLIGQTPCKGKMFHDIRVHPSDPNTVVAATSDGVFRSTDGGTNWTNTRSGEATDLEVDPSPTTPTTGFSRQYAGIMNPSDVDGLYRSTNGGQSWTLLTTVPWGATQFDDVARIELAIAPSDVNVLYAAIGSTTDGGLKGLWRTTNAWAATPTWTQINTQATKVNGVVVSSYCTGQCWYDHELLVKPTNKDLLFAGGVNFFKYDATTGTWTDIGRVECPTPSLPGCIMGIHSDIHTMAWVGSRLIVGSDGGLFSTTDDGANWTPHNLTLAITEFYKGSIHPTNAVVAQGGAQDDGSSRRPTTGGINWDYVFPSDGGDNFFTNSNPDTRWALSTYNLGLVRFKEPNGTQCNVFESIPDRSGVPFIAPVRACPKNDDVVLAGTDNIWKTTQMFSATCNPQGTPPSPQWTKVCSGDADGGEYGAGVEAVAFAPGVSTCNTFAFGSDDGDLRITTNGGGSTCTNLDPNNQVRDANVTGVALHPCFGESPSLATNTETIFITIGWPGGPHVYRTTDALSGRNWSDVTPTDGGGVPFDVFYQSVLVDPLIPNHVYVGTELGAWRSTDSAGTWQRIAFSDGLPYVPIADWQLNGKTDRLTAFTHGRSAYQATLNRCVGDCNGDGAVTVAELITMTNIKLGNKALCMCAIGDANRDGVITSDEQAQAQNNANNSCPA